MKIMAHQCGYSSSVHRSSTWRRRDSTVLPLQQVHGGVAGDKERPRLTRGLCERRYELGIAPATHTISKWRGTAGQADAECPTSCSSSKLDHRPFQVASCPPRQTL